MMGEAIFAIVFLLLFVAALSLFVGWVLVIWHFIAWVFGSIRRIIKW